MSAPLQHGLFQNVYLSPLKAANKGLLDFIGGLAKPDDYPSYARHNRHNHHVDVALPALSPTPERLEGQYVYGGILFDHFGHLITESLHRLWITDLPAYKGWPVVFTANRKNPFLETVVPEVMALFGISNFHILHEDTVVDTLAIGQMGRQLARPSEPAYIDWLKQKIDLKPLIDPTFPKKLCVMRSHLWSGRLLGEAQIEGWLASDDYHILRPENHTLRDQLKYLVNAEKIVFSEGSAIHLLDLLPPIKARVALLQRRPHSRMPSSSLAQKAKSLDLFTNVAPALHYRNRPLKARHNALAFAPLNEVRVFLVKHGFLKKGCQPYGYVKKAYTEDLLYFSQNELVIRPRPSLAPGAQLDRAIEDLLIDHRKAVQAISHQQFLKCLLRAQFFQAQGSYGNALGSARRALHLMPESAEAKALLAAIEKNAKKETNWLARMGGRILRALKMLTGRVSRPQLPPETKDTPVY